MGLPRDIDFKKVNCYRLVASVCGILSATVSLCQPYEDSEIFPVPDMSFHPGVFTGLDILEETDFGSISNRTLAILTNQTAVNREGIHILDLLSRRRDDFDVKVIFTPEFGILSSETEQVSMFQDGKDPWFGARIKNLWGREFIPDINDLRDVDLIVIDMQDPGIRLFSFMTTVTKVMEAAALHDIPVMVLDRPNPLNGVVIDGPVVRPRFQSFLGYHLVPIRHGLTIGEYALMINETGWIRGSKRAQLKIIPMANWKRDMWMDETGLPWIVLAPNVGDLTTLLACVGMGLVQGTNISSGEGTDGPYLQIGAPWIYSKTLLRSLNIKSLPGVRFSEVTFHPDSLSMLVSNPRYRGEECEGVRLEITNRDAYSPILTSVTALSAIAGHYPHSFRWVANNHVDKLYGHDYLRIFLAQERDPKKLPATWSHDVIRFSKFRSKFLLY